ncbi:MAG: tripartite tricarboxylate transporter permease [Spirochaetales bacterium]|nr:tripartite tricarboxylate transporter permease [Spirochaetales bacterium]
MNELLVASIIGVFNPTNLLLVLVGVVAGTVVGALPGLTATMAIALLVPFTFTMQPVHGLILMGGIYVSAIYGGSFSAILLNTPGTPSAIATCFDGYPMARRGQSYQAIVTATMASVLGGLLGVLLLLFLSPPLSRLSLRFGPPEFFWLTTFGLTIIATLSTGSILKGLIGGAFGLLLSMIGIAPIEGSVRFTFGWLSLQNGIALIPALIGFFCVPEVLGMIERKGEHHTAIPYRRQRRVLWRVFIRIVRRPFLVVRSAVIGTIVGIIPGAGGNIAAMVAYNEAVRASRNPDTFGKGNPDGVVAAEAANNAEVSGSLIPLLTLGIPGAPPAAVLLGALLLHGMRPGRELFTNHGVVTYTFMLSLVVANLLILPVGIFSGRWISRLITRLPVTLLAPTVFFLSVIGSFAINRNVFDVYVMLFFGLIGYVGKKMNFSAGPIVLGLILGSICEQGLVQSILMGRAAGSVAAMFFTRPLSLVLIVLTVVSAAWPFAAKALRKVRERGRR